MPASLEFVADSTESRNLMGWLGQLLERHLFSEAEKPLEAQTFQSGKLMPFVGFGDKNFKSSDVLSQFNVSQELKLHLTPEEWIEALDDQFIGERLLNREVTDIETENDAVSAIVVNGSQKLTADTYVFALSPHRLAQWTPPTTIDSKTRQKIAKSITWTALQLHFQHPRAISTSSALHFLMGSKTDFEPCLGRWISRDDQYFSTWLSLIPSDQTEDVEAAGAVIRNMKKQIKRAYPEALEELLEEKIVVHPDWCGHMKLPSKWVSSIPDMRNLLLASRHLSPMGHVLSDIEMAQKTLEAYSSKSQEDQDASEPSA
jgi:hypothetical protein